MSNDPNQASPSSPVNEPDITVAITCFNEQEFIVDSMESVIGALRECGFPYEVIVVDDVSKDDSVLRVREYMKKHPEYPIRLITNRVNRGLGNNYVEAAFLGKGKYYRLCCGDNAEPKEVLVQLFRHLGKADMVIPYQNQEKVAGKSRFRKLLSRTFTFLLNFISGYRIKYYNGLAIHLRYNVLRWHPTSYGFGFQADLITRLLDEGASYVQVPSTSIDRKGSASAALKMRNILSVGHTLLEIASRRLRRMLYGRTMPTPVEIELSEQGK